MVHEYQWYLLGKLVKLSDWRPMLLKTKLATYLIQQKYCENDFEIIVIILDQLIVISFSKVILMCDFYLILPKKLLT